MQQQYSVCKWVTPVDLNPNDCLFGGRLLQWIDEEAALFLSLQLGSRRIATKFISSIDFLAAPKRGDIVEINFSVTHVGNTSINLSCRVINKITSALILQIGKIVFVNIGADGKPEPHGKTGVV